MAGFSLSGDGNWLAARRLLRMDDEPTVVVIDTRTGDMLSGVHASTAPIRLFDLCGPTAPIRRNSTWRQAILSADESLLATSYHEFVTLWNAASGRHLHTLEHRDHDNAYTVWTMSFSPDGRTLASGSAGGHIKLWDVHTGQLRLSLPHPRGTVQSVAFDPSGACIATAAKEVRFWDASSGELRWATAGADQRYGGLVFDLNGTRLAVSARRRLTVFDTATGEALSPRQDRSRSTFTCLAVSPTNNQLVFGDKTGQLTTWDYLEGKKAASWQAHTSSVAQVAYAPDGQTLCSSGIARGGIILWDAHTGALRHTLERRVGGRSRFAFSSDGSAVVTAVDSQAPAKLWDLARFEVRRGVQLEPRTSPFLLAFGRGSDTLFEHSRQQLILRDLSRNRVMKRFEVDRGRGGIRRFAISPDGTRVAGGVLGGHIIVWNLEDESQLELVKGHSNRYLRALAFSRDCEKLASAAEDGKVQIWDPHTGESIRSIRVGPREAIIEQLTFSATDQHLITRNGNGSIYVVDLEQTP